MSLPFDQFTEVNGLVELPLRPLRTLYETTHPLVFTTLGVSDQLFLAYVCEQETAEELTLLAPTSAAAIDRLEAGSVALRDCLTNSWLLLVREHDGDSGIYSVGDAAAITAYLPMEGVPLLPEHRAALRVRAVGDSLTFGEMPASAVAFVADAVRKAMKCILDSTSPTDTTTGRPRDDYRVLYDLPIRRFAFSSFELSFASPRADSLIPIEEELENATKLLEAGLRWAEGGDDSVMEGLDPEARNAVLQALKHLAPPQRSPISSVVVSGRWNHGRSSTLTSEVRSRATRLLRASSRFEVLSMRGRIGEADADRSTCIIREHDQESLGRDLRASFREDLLDDILQFLQSSEPCCLSLYIVDTNHHVVAIAPAQTDAES